MRYRLAFALVLGLAVPSLAGAQTRVELPASDGSVVADEYGRGDRAVVLAHGGRFDRISWRRQATARRRRPSTARRARSIASC